MPRGWAVTGSRKPAAKPASSEEGEGAIALRVWLRFVRLDQRLRLLMGHRLREIGLSIPQFDVLSALSENAGMTQRELGQRLFVTKGNVSGLIDRLVQAHLVERRSAERDRRSHALHLTVQGEKVVAAALAAQQAFVDDTLGKLGKDDLAALLLLLGRWRDLARQADQKQLEPPDRAQKREALTAD